MVMVLARIPIAAKHMLPGNMKPYVAIKFQIVNK